MVLVHDREPSALGVIFDRHGGPAFSMAFRMCGRRTIAEDVVQEAFLALWHSSVRYDRSRGSVRSWLLWIVHNRAVDAFRRESVVAGREVLGEAVLADMPAREFTDREVQRREDARHVRSALESLPREQRQVIELAYFGGFSHTQIADMLELSTGTVKGRMLLGLSKMRIALAAGVTS